MFEIQNLHVNISEVDKKIIDGINLKTGDLMRDDWFPRVFSN